VVWIDDIAAVTCLHVIRDVPKKLRTIAHDVL
jgi:hypothetical protein